MRVQVLKRTYYLEGVAFDLKLVQPLPPLKQFVETVVGTQL